MDYDGKPITRLTKADSYMMAICKMKLPDGSIVSGVLCSRTVLRDNYSIVQAQATVVSSNNKSTLFYGSGPTIESALLELAAEILINYPAGDSQDMEIDLPMRVLIDSETFKDWFKRRND